jgi:hypothetical protein
VNGFTARVAAALSEAQSTRPAALLRMGLCALLWARFGSELILSSRLGGAHPLLSLSFFAATSLSFLGVASRWTSAWVAGNALFLYYGLGQMEKHEPYQHHHVAALAFGAVCVASLPTGGSWSVDRALAVARARRQGVAPPPEVGPTWGRYLLMAHILAIYGWGTFAKLTPAYMNGTRFTHYAMSLYIGSDIPKIPGFSLLMVALAWGGILVEPMIGLGLLFPRTRLWAFGLGLFFHATIYWTMPVATFSMTMWLFYLAFFPPDALMAQLARWSGDAPPAR